MAPPRVVFVIPCFGVSRQLPAVLAAVPSDVACVIVVDDGSPDDVAAVVRAIGSPRVVLLRHERNRGVAQAMVTGFRHALEIGADIVVKVDGDGQMPLDQLPRLLAPLLSGEADLTKGNRLMHRRHLRTMPRARLGGNLLLSFLTKVASGYWNIFDPTNGFIAVRRQVLEEMDLDRLGPRYFFEISLLCEAYTVGAVARDVPMPAVYGSHPSSLSLPHTALAFPWLLVRAVVRRVLLQYFVRDFTPVALFLVTGVLLAGAGGTFGLVNWIANSHAGRATPTGTVVLALLPLLVGFQLLLQALVMDIGNVPTRNGWRGGARVLPEDYRPDGRECAAAPSRPAPNTDSARANTRS